MNSVYKLPTSEIQVTLRKIIWKMDDESENFLFKVVVLALWVGTLLSTIDLIIWSIGVLILPIGLIWNKWLRDYMYKRLEVIGTNLEYLETLPTKSDSIEIILKRLELIHIAIIDIQFRKKFIKLFYSKRVEELYELLLTLVSAFSLKHLIHLRSDLQTRLTEQQKSLEWAKAEVEKNIQWTTELNQVSELQKARLDRQIEQFEELQRVLVKM